MDNEIKILQWNCHFIRANQESLDYLMKKMKLDIILLNETWLKPTDKYFKAGFTVHREDRDMGYGGVAILVKNAFPNKKPILIIIIPTLKIWRQRLHFLIRKRYPLFLFMLPQGQSLAFVNPETIRGLPDLRGLQL